MIVTIKIKATISFSFSEDVLGLSVKKDLIPNALFQVQRNINTAIPQIKVEDPVGIVPVTVKFDDIDQIEEKEFHHNG